VSAVYGSARTTPIVFPGKPGRPPKSGHTPGTRPHGIRMNAGHERRRVVRQAPVVRPIAADQRLLDVRQAAQYLGLSVWTVREMVAAGKLPKVSLGVRRTLVDRVALDAQLASGQ
jgi:excisionase family DNA binding protein